MPELIDRNGPALWDAILDAVGPYWNPVIAGGCIRDLFLGVPAKDVDVFVPAEYVEDLTSIVDQLSPVLAHGRMVWTNAEAAETEADLEWAFRDMRACEAQTTYSGDGFAPDLIGVWEGEIIGVPVNIIGRRSLEEGPSFLVKTFDFDILKAYHGTHGHTIQTEEFARDIRDKTATLAHRLSRPQSLQRFARFNARNPGVLTLKDRWA